VSRKTACFVVVIFSSSSSGGGGDMGDDTSVTGRQRTLKWLDTTP